MNPNATRVVAIIQARMGSSRLPGKMLMRLAGKPVIQQVHERTKAIEGVGRVLVATTTESKDDPLAAFCAAAAIPVFRGNPDDVLDRYYQAALQEEADVVIRITGDCPFLDPVESAKVLRRLFDDGGCDYVCNGHPATLPDGLDTEAMTFDALRRAWQHATSRPDREHVTLFIRNHPDLFRLRHVGSAENLSFHRWTLDEERDHAFLDAVAVRLARAGKYGFLREIVDVLAAEPELMELNRHIGRNEGLAKSLHADAAASKRG